MFVKESKTLDLAMTFPIITKSSRGLTIGQQINIHTTKRRSWSLLIRINKNRYFEVMSRVRQAKNGCAQIRRKPLDSFVTTVIKEVIIICQTMISIMKLLKWYVPQKRNYVSPKLSMANNITTVLIKQWWCILNFRWFCILWYKYPRHMLLFFNNVAINDVSLEWGSYPRLGVFPILT